MLVFFPPPLPTGVGNVTRSGLPDPEVRGKIFWGVGCQSFAAFSEISVVFSLALCFLFCRLCSIGRYAQCSLHLGVVITATEDTTPIRGGGAVRWPQPAHQ